MALEKKCVDTIRCISAALPEAANSGHPGGPMGGAPLTHVLFSKIMKYSPSHPDWVGRDRFILSNGHASALLYTMLHLCGYDMTVEDIKNFRQLHSKTPGHPEKGAFAGIEVTTGPLGQGISQGVGMAMAAEIFCAKYNTPDITLFDPFIYVLLGEGCLQEGVVAEAVALAGHLQLGRLIVVFDCNDITIDGPVSLAFTENVAKRFEAHDWQVLSVEDGDHDTKAVEDAVLEAKANLKQPSLIICRTTIGYGCSLENTSKVHGAPIGAAELKKCRERLGLKCVNEDDLFEVAPDVRQYYLKCGEKGDQLYAKWMTLCHDKYLKKYPHLYESLQTQLKCDDVMKKWVDTEEWRKAFEKFSAASKPEATRVVSGRLLNLMAETFPFFLGGSADLMGSNCTALKCTTAFNGQNRNGRYVHYGIREHAMAAASNGMIAFGGFRPFCATYLNFVTYAWGAVRLSALSKLPVLYILTHDSIELGEDGPTHQPIEIAALCRATPNLLYIRPADGKETQAAFLTWLASKETPVALALCRNSTPHFDGTSIELAMEHGAYVVRDFNASSLKKIILAACGTELNFCMQAAQAMQTKANIRVVSMPCWDIFEKQSKEYKLGLFPKEVEYKLYVEAANVPQYPKYFDDVIQMEDFGASAPTEVLQKLHGFTAQSIVQKIEQHI